MISAAWHQMLVLQSGIERIMLLNHGGMEPTGGGEGFAVQNRAELFGHRFDVEVRLAIVGNIQLMLPDDLIPSITVGPDGGLELMNHPRCFAVPFFRLNVFVGLVVEAQLAFCIFSLLVSMYLLFWGGTADILS